VAPEVADAVDADRERLSAWGSQLGLPRTVRILETFGLAMREMKSAPEKVVTLEVALVRLIRPELDSSLEALDERVSRLERDGTRASVPSAPAPAAVLRPIGATPTPAAPKPSPPSQSPPTPSTGPTPASSSGDAPLDVDDVRERFEKRVVPRTPRSAQLLLKDAQVRTLEGHRLIISLPNEELRQNTEYIAAGLRSAMDHEFKVPLQIEWVVDSSPTSPMASQPRTERHDPEANVAEDHDVADESTVVVDSMAGHLINEMFPGAEEVS
jgi:hypothetical protein